jgi:ABC-type antimicrobial peptide transport system permease subunit
MRRYLPTKEKIRVILQILRINLRTSVITLIGLSIALSTITTSLIYLETNKTDYYLSLFEQEDFRDSVIYNHDPNDLQSFTKAEDLLSLQESLDQKISERGLENVLVKHPLYPICYLNNRIEFLNQAEWSSFYGLNLNESILEDCAEGSYLPTNMNETILLNSSLSGLNIGDYYNISIHLGNSEYYSHTLRITGLITTESLSNSSLLNEIFPPFAFDREYIRILTPLGEFLNLINNIDTKIDSSPNNSRLIVRLLFRVDIQISNINYHNVMKITSTLFSFLSETETFYLNGISLNSLSNSVFSTWIHYLDEFDIFFFYFLCLCIPAFLAAILLVRFSLGLIHERRKKSLLLFRTRGISSQFLFKTLLLEMVVISLIAALISIVVGTFGCLFFSTTTGYLTFDLAYIPTRLAIPPLLVPLTISISVGFTFITSFRPMIRLSKLKLVLLDQETTGTTPLKPRKIPKNINSVLFILGLAGMIILILILQLINESKLDIESSELFMLFSPVITVLLILSPISFLIGFIFTYNQFIPLLTKKLGQYCWKKDWGILATAIRNLSVNHRITGQVTLLIACTLSFLMILSSLPVSNYQYMVDSAYYDNTAEISISISQTDTDKTLLQELTTQLSSIQGLQFTTVSMAGFEVRDNEGIRHWIYFCGIDENFHQVAHWQDYYDDQPLEEIVQALFNSTKTFPIILDSNTAQKERVIPNDIYRPFPTEPNLIEFSVEGVSDNWPGFIITRDSTYHFVIVQRTLLETISNTIYDSDAFVGWSISGDKIFCKLTTGYDPDVITNQILNVIKNHENLVSIGTVKSTIENMEQHLLTRFLWIITNFNFMDSLFVVLIIIVLFTVFRISTHTTEIGLSRALGMKYKQVFLLMFIEPVVLFLLSGIPGGCVGLLFLIFVTATLSPLLVPVPPFILDFNLHIIISVYLIIFLVTIISGVVTSLLATRADISKLLKVE